VQIRFELGLVARKTAMVRARRHAVRRRLAQEPVGARAGAAAQMGDVLDPEVAL
jgi:hypothetical protein